MIFRTIDEIVRPIEKHDEKSYMARLAYDRDRHALSWQYRDRRSFLKPNARCPACGQLVWFYKSPDDGRVYFDEIGPPWPKHPCTDSRSDKDCYRKVSGRTFLENAKRSRRRYHNAKNIRWYSAGWRPAFGFACVHMSKERIDLKVSFNSAGGNPLVLSIRGEDVAGVWGDIADGVEAMRRGLLFLTVEGGRVFLAGMDSNLNEYRFEAMR
ncbi:hypothetical protein [Alloalcanivorax profundimaris]|uniref:hypothetical protein n=2 Tax=Alloalcanivorax TaxID=3020832 RepID=UPI0018E4950A|nr:hypothetical protein [Alloalcanivorax profundimaris]